MTAVPTAHPAWLCRCEEIDRQAAQGAVAAGARTINDVKRRTRAGMGWCQGAYCVDQIAELLAAETDQTMDEIAPMTARPPARTLPLKAVALKETEEDRSAR